MPRHDQTQRMRVTFGVSEPLCYVSVLDMGRMWERLLNRAHAPVSYTQGFNPHARLFFAAALPLGYCSSCEIVDLMLAETMTVDALEAQLSQAAPPGIQILSVIEAELHDRAPLKSMREAEYEVTVCGVDPEGTQERIEQMLSRKSIERERIKKGQKRSYDLRPLISSIELQTANDECIKMHMRLACGPNGSGRPEEIVKELLLDNGDSRFTIVRKALIWGKTLEGDK